MDAFVNQRPVLYWRPPDSLLLFLFSLLVSLHAAAMKSTSMLLRERRRQYEGWFHFQRSACASVSA